MELDNQILLQPEVSPPDTPQPPQLLMISTQAVQGTTSIGTFSLMVSIGGKKGITLVDSEALTHSWTISLLASSIVISSPQIPKG
jgi:hypothetical protein